ncbi:MAG TPA: hypothetical protein VEC99_13510, partial [Clostridia bacterium]|nr:hypothetical protein [Clostridia bacterium]
MVPLSCDLECLSSSEHLNQVYTGLALLRQRRLINLTARKGAAFKGGTTGAPKLLVQVNRSLRLAYDTEDDSRLDAKILDSCDFYFKRSYDEEFCKQHPQASKIHPL